MGPNLSFDETTPCILSFELKELIIAMDQLQEGETEFIMDFIEPYLSFAITGIEDYFALQIRYIYDTSGKDWKDVYVCQKFSLRDLKDLSSKLKVLYHTFPIKNVQG